MKEFNTAIDNLRFVISQLRALTGRHLDEGQLGEIRRCAGMLDSLLRSIEDGPIPRTFRRLDPDSEHAAKL